MNFTKKPILALDVDGVLNRFENDGTLLETEFRVFEAGFWLTLNTEHKALLEDAAKTFEIHWCTAWNTLANEHVGPRIGLPSLPVIATVNGRPKSDCIDIQHSDRVIVWIDDNFWPEDLDWANNRKNPILLIRANPWIGLLPEHIQQAKEWLDSLHHFGDGCTYE